MTDSITLTREEVREAREGWGEWMWQLHKYFSCFFDYYDVCEESQDEAICRLCKKLTEFAEGGEDE